MLICPLCSAALGEVDNGVACPAGHRFDRARQALEGAITVSDPGSPQARAAVTRREAGVVLDRLV